MGNRPIPYCFSSLLLHLPLLPRPLLPTRLSNALSQQEQELMRLRAAFAKLGSQSMGDSHLGRLQADLDKACDGVIGMHSHIEKSLCEVLRHGDTHTQVNKYLLTHEYMYTVTHNCFTSSPPNSAH